MTAKNPRPARPCVVCGVEFVPRTKQVITCGKTCRKKRDLEGKREYDRKRYAENPEYRQRQIDKSAHRFATDAGYREREVERNRRVAVEQREASQVPTVCGRCGGVFETHSKKKKYCSADCREAEMRARKTARTMERYHADPEFRAKLLAGRKTPEGRERWSEYMRGWCARLKATDPDRYQEHLQRTRDWFYARSNAQALFKLAVDAGKLMEMLKCKNSQRQPQAHAIPIRTWPPSVRCRLRSCTP